MRDISEESTWEKTFGLLIVSTSPSLEKDSKEFTWSSWWCFPALWGARSLHFTFCPRNLEGQGTANNCSGADLLHFQFSRAKVIPVDWREQQMTASQQESGVLWVPEGSSKGEARHLGSEARGTSVHLNWNDCQSAMQGMWREVLC